jgi:hypothetical protein
MPWLAAFVHPLEKDFVCYRVQRIRALRFYLGSDLAMLKQCLSYVLKRAVDDRGPGQEGIMV